MPYKIAFVSLGCAKNLVNTEQMMALCCKAGHIVTGDPKGADVAVLNTCGFIESAKSEAIENILELAQLKEQGQLKKLLVTGCLLFASDRVRHGRKTERSATLIDVLIVGVAQAIATCPGISRSGTTITAGCFVGFERKFAVRFSFLLSIPAILGANILSLKDAAEAGIDWASVPVYLVGVAVSAVVGYVCIRLLKMIAAKGRFGWFAYYCWFAGAATLLLTIVTQ